MSTGTEEMRERMTDYLRGQGVQCVSAWPEGESLRPEAPTVCVSIRSCAVEPGSFSDYLGERYNEETGLWQELYGKKLSLTFGLDLYALPESQPGEMQTALDKLTLALAQGGPEGMTVEGFSTAEAGYDSATRLLKREVQAVCRAYLWAAQEENETFLDFTLRGGVKQ